MDYVLYVQLMTSSTTVTPVAMGVLLFIEVIRAHFRFIANPFLK